MLRSAFGFLTIGVRAAFAGFAGILGGASVIAKFLFFLFLGVFLFLLVMAILTGRSFLVSLASLSQGWRPKACNNLLNN